MKIHWLALSVLISCMTSSLILGSGITHASEPRSISAWPALRTGLGRAETLLSVEIEDEIATRVLDDRTLEYLHRIAPDRATYQNYKKRILDKAWEPGLLQITREKIWENVGAGLGLALTQREMKEAVQRLSEMDSALGVSDLRRLLLHEVNVESTDQEILSFRRRQLRKRAWTQLRAAFAQAVQKSVIDSKSSKSSAPREVQARYEELKAKSQATVFWKGLTSPAVKTQELNASLRTVHQWLETHASGRITLPNSLASITSWKLDPETAQKISRQTSVTLPLPSDALPEELGALNLQVSSLTHSLTFLVASEASPGTARIELWRAERIPLPTLQEAYQAIDQALTEERHQKVLLRELQRALRNSPTLLKLKADSRALSGDALFERLMARN